jgi:hypothetical protein
MPKLMVTEGFGFDVAAVDVASPGAANDPDADVSGVAGDKLQAASDTKVANDTSIW